MTLLIGGLNCFCRMISGPLALLRIATMPTPSMVEFLGLVGRSACSQVRSMPLGSVYVVLAQTG